MNRGRIKAALRIVEEDTCLMRSDKVRYTRSLRTSRIVGSSGATRD